MFTTQSQQKPPTHATGVSTREREFQGSEVNDIYFFFFYYFFEKRRTLSSLAECPCGLARRGPLGW